MNEDAPLYFLIFQQQRYFLGIKTVKLEFTSMSSKQSSKIHIPIFHDYESCILKNVLRATDQHVIHNESLLFPYFPSLSFLPPSRW